MKTMFGKYIALIVAVLVMSGCGNVFKHSVSEKTPAGSGYFSLVINEANTGRTIVPATVQYDYLLYTLEFFAAGTTSNPVNRTERNNSNLSDPILLNAGTWDLYVIAYMDVEKNKPAAKGFLKNITIGSAETVSQNITLTPIIEEGEGIFKWNIDYPSTVTLASMTILPLNSDSGTPESTLYFTGGMPLTGQDHSLTLNAGYYRVVFNLSIDDMKTERREILHIYKNMESAFEYTFTEEQFSAHILITSDADDGTGSLRQIVTDAPDGSTIIIDPSVKTIYLESRLIIRKNFTIVGNGVIITRASSWTTVDAHSSLLGIADSSLLTISQVHFKDGRSTSYASAIRNDGNLTLESCIFSGNQSKDKSAYSVTQRDVCHTILNNNTLNVMGCTFYNNYSEYCGVVIYNNYSSRIVTLEGNLFYQNTRYDFGYIIPGAEVVTNGTTVSRGYNVVDVPIGPGNGHTGWEAGTGDKTITALPISGKSYRLLSGSGAENVIAEPSVDYPVFDFYGNPIGTNAAAGAVQAHTSGSGYFFDLTLNTDNRGTVSVSSQPDEDGLYPANTTLTTTATPADESYYFAYFLVNGSRSTGNSLVINKHTMAQAVFGQCVTNFGDDQYWTPIPTGTLRYASTRLLDVDAIRCIGVVPGETTIALSTKLGIQGFGLVLRNITIEGMGITLTQGENWVSSDPIADIYNLNPLVFCSEYTGSVTIERVHFKNGREDYGGSSNRFPPASAPAAIYNIGNLTLESCIFSGNRSSNNNGGAISNNRTINIRGCTFYNNYAGNNGGAIFTSYGGNTILEGNLFYGNTSGSAYPIAWVAQQGSTQGILTSRGYNVVDVVLGTLTNQSGWAAANTDTTFTTLGITSVPFSVTTFMPVATPTNLRNRMTSRPAEFPLTDFYGNTRTYPGAPGAVKGQ